MITNEREKLVAVTQEVFVLYRTFSFFENIKTVVNLSIFRTTCFITQYDVVKDYSVLTSHVEATIQMIVGSLLSRVYYP